MNAEAPKTPLGAVCGVHPERVAVRVCTRCGDFACSECVSRSSNGLCPACHARTGAGGRFPLNRDNWTVGNVFRHAWRTMVASPWNIMGMTWVLSLPLGLIMLAPMIAFVTMNAQGPDVSQEIYSLRGRLLLTGFSTASMLLSSPLLLGLLAYVAKRLDGEPAWLEVVPANARRAGQFALLILMILPVTWCFSLLQTATPKPTAAQTVTNILVSLPTWPLIFLQYVAAMELVLDHEITAVQALQRAWSHVRRRPVRALWTALLQSLVMMSSMFCCLLPVVFFAPFALLGFVTLCLAMRTPAPVATEAEASPQLGA